MLDTCQYLLTPQSYGSSIQNPKTTLNLCFHYHRHAEQAHTLRQDADRLRAKARERSELRKQRRAKPVTSLEVEIDTSGDAEFEAVQELTADLKDLEVAKISLRHGYWKASVPLRTVVNRESVATCFGEHDSPT